MDNRRTTDGQAAAEGRDTKDRDHGLSSPLEGLRASDIEPYTGLRYLSKLFRFMAVVLLLVLVAEAATGLYTQGMAAIPTLLGEASRLVVLAGVLWGTGDLAHLLIDVGHDVRAGRILLARQVHHMTGGKGQARLTSPVITTPGTTTTQSGTTGSSASTSDRL